MLREHDQLSCMMLKQLCRDAHVAPPSPRQLANRGWCIAMQHTCEAIIQRNHQTKLLKRITPKQAELFGQPVVDVKARAAGDY